MLGPYLLLNGGSVQEAFAECETKKILCKQIPLNEIAYVNAKSSLSLPEHISHDSCQNKYAPQEKSTEMQIFLFIKILQSSESIHLCSKINPTGTTTAITVKNFTVICQHYFDKTSAEGYETKNNIKTLVFLPIKIKITYRNIGELAEWESVGLI